MRSCTWCPPSICGHADCRWNSGANNGAPSETRFDAAAFEYSYWETIKNSNNSDDFKAYLEKYPSGQFVTLAKNRIESLRAPAKPAEPTPSSSISSAAELAFWDSIKNSTNIEDFNAYLRKYPNGDFAELAKNRIKSLESAVRQKETEEIAKGSLEGTVWKGTSPGGDKQYEFKFLKGGDVQWLFAMGKFRLDHEGTWRQVGNNVYMEMHRRSDGWTGKLPIEATMNGNGMEGSYGSGKYKFTLTKVQ